MFAQKLDRKLAEHDPVHRLRPEGMLAAGDQADKVACQAEACDLAPSVTQHLEQPQRPDRHIVDVPHGVAFTEPRTARPKRHERTARSTTPRRSLTPSGPKPAPAATP